MTSQFFSKTFFIPFRDSGKVEKKLYICRTKSYVVFMRLLGLFFIWNVLNLPPVYAQDKLEALEKTLPTLQQPTARIDALNQLAAHYLERDINKSSRYAQEARQIAEEKRYPKGEAIARTNIGNLYAQVGDYENAVQAFLKALKIVDDNQFLEQKQLLLNSIGSIYRTQKNYTKAIQQFDEALKIAEKLHLEKAIADCENNLGTCYYLTKENEAASQYYERALKTREKLRDTLGVAKVKNNLALIFKRQKRYEEALQYFEYTLKVQQKYKSKGGLAVVLDNIGDTYFAQNNFSNALKYQSEGLALAREVNNKMVLLDAYNSLAETYLAMKDFEKAYQYQNNYLLLQDSLNNYETQKNLSDQHIAYTLEKQEQEIELAKQQTKVQKLELEQSRNLILMIGAVLILSIGLGISLYVRYQHKRRANDALAEKNKEIEQRAEEMQAQAKEINKQSIIILDNHVKLTDSILYAKRIQDALLLKEQKIAQIWQDTFVFYQPKDIVSGDFYWVDAKYDAMGVLNKLVVVVADCTGHGVPGAFMTVLGHSLLNQIVREKEVIAPAKILQALDNAVSKTLHQDARAVESSASDGMDIAIAIWDLPAQVLTFGSAKRPLYYFHKGEILTIKGGKFSIGGNDFGVQKEFVQHDVQAEAGDVFYLFSDGYTDQFGDNPNVKYTARRFRELLAGIGHENMSQQKKLIQHHFETWRGAQKQTDDVLIIGLKIS